MNTQTTPATAINAGVRGPAHAAAISTEEIKARIEPCSPTTAPISSVRPADTAA
ncbi:hypothetical protein [Rhodococcus sp. ACPA1]|uniref:hypothetical protein n=1 Tax=Rhodococcus sp. ACPA1 TaxID=2028572 RepID=UPI0015C81A09|nr:hypothetical protein [Rhodococcus sp. ACPA1]